MPPHLSFHIQPHDSRRRQHWLPGPHDRWQLLAVQAGQPENKPLAMGVAPAKVVSLRRAAPANLAIPVPQWADAFNKSKCPSVCVFVCLCVCPFTFEVPFKRLFAPTSRSRMSNNFRDTKSWGKSNGKK